MKAKSYSPEGNYEHLFSLLLFMGVTLFLARVLKVPNNKKGNDHYS